MTDKPRCPLRMAGFDQPDSCDANCAWLMTKIDAERSVCAVAVIAGKYDLIPDWKPVNY